METPTQMTTGVAQNVGAQTASFGNETDMRIGNGIPEGVFEEQTPVITSEGTYRLVHPEARQSQDNETSSTTNTADMLLQSAKEEGFEEALIRLANGDFEDKTVGTEEHIDEDSQEVEELNEEADEEILEIPEDEIPLSEQISILEGEVEVLKKETLRLSEKIIGLLVLWQKLVEEEKDEDKKVNMLEVIFNFLVFFMKEMFVPVDENIKTQHVEKVAPKKKSKVSSEQILEVLKMFKNQNAAEVSQTPHIEKMAA